MLITELNLDGKTKACLLRGQYGFTEVYRPIRTVEELLELTHAELCNFKGIGYKRFSQILKVLKDYLNN